MAMIRRTCHTIVPLAFRIRALATSSSSFLTAASGSHQVVKNIPIIGHDVRLNHVVHRSINQYSFSTSASSAAYPVQKKLMVNHKLIKHLRSQYYWLSEEVPEAPRDFPFVINDNPGILKQMILLRELGGEKIEVEVNGPYKDNTTSINVASSVWLDIKKFFFGPSYDQDNGSMSSSGMRKIDKDIIQLRVKISKVTNAAAGKVLEFDVRANNGTVRVRNVCIDKLDTNYGAEYWMEGDRQKSWKDFLALRGIEDGVFVDFLMKYMVKRKDRDHFIFYKNIKKFVKA